MYNKKKRVFEKQIISMCPISIVPKMNCEKCDAMHRKQFHSTSTIEELSQNVCVVVFMFGILAIDHDREAEAKHFFTIAVHLQTTFWPIVLLSHTYVCR